MIRRLDAQVAPVRVFPRQIKQIDASEDGEEATEERDGVDRIGGIETAEEDERRDQGKGRECHIV